MDRQPAVSLLPDFNEAAMELAPEVVMAVDDPMVRRNEVQGQCLSHEPKEVDDPQSDDAEGDVGDELASPARSRVRDRVSGSEHGSKNPIRDAIWIQTNRPTDLPRGATGGVIDAARQRIRRVLREE